MKKFTRDFFLRDPLLVARDLLGAELLTSFRGKQTSGMIVEAEAYGARDPASHSYRGLTPRNRTMFEAGGFCYVYLIYGIYNCVNVVTEMPGVGSAVLIRSIAPLQGIELMKKRRNVTDLRKVTSGPGRICQALSISRTFDGEDLLSSDRIYLRPFRQIGDSDIGYSRRIGISKARELDWRVFIKGSEFVSR